MNVVIIGGNLTRDPELRYTPKGTALCQFGIANNREWKNEGGETMAEVSFFDCVAWGRMSEVIAQYFKKGRPIFVRGRLKQESWEDKQTKQKRHAVKIIVEGFDFAGDAKGEGGRPAQVPATGEHPQQSPPDNGVQPPAPEDDQVPF